MMKTQMYAKIVALSIIFFVGVIVVSHFYTQIGYDWTQNTISELASQTHKYKWIMQFGFIGFGILLNAGLIVKFTELKRINYPDVLIMLYGTAILVTGFYCEKPIDETISYSLSEARIHSIFAMVAGVCLSLGILWYLIASTSASERFFHIAFLILVMGISLVFGLSENEIIGVGKGLVQRSLYLTSFIWLFTSQWYRFRNI
jgi:hypothetical membrane protein